MVKVERGRVLVNSSWQPLRGKPFHKSRIMDVPCLLRSALRRILTVPDVEMVVCGSDVPSRPAQGEERVPYLHGVQQVGTAHAIPVPVWSRCGCTTVGAESSRRIGVRAARWRS